MKKIFSFLRPVIFFACLYFLWLVYSVYTYQRNPKAFEKDLPTNLALIFFAISGWLLLFIAYKVFKFIRSKRSKSE